MKTLMTALSISMLAIGCGAGAMSNAMMLDRNLHKGTIQLQGERGEAMAEAEALMERHCGEGFVIDRVSGAGELDYHCTSQRDIYGELPPVLAKNSRR